MKSRRWREPDRRAAYAEAVLHALPEWFGIPESTAAYIAESRRQPFWAALHGDEVWGFIALQETSPAAVELAVMGVRPEMHRSGMGRALFDAARAWAKACGLSHDAGEDGTRGLLSLLRPHERLLSLLRLRAPRMLPHALG